MTVTWKKFSNADIITSFLETVYQIIIWETFYMRREFDYEQIYLYEDKESVVSLSNFRFATEASILKWLLTNAADYYFKSPPNWLDLPVIKVLLI